MTRPVYIYTLCERGKDEVRYVGQTVNPEQRLKAHVGDSRLESSHPKERWIAEVLMMGSDIEMRIVEECTGETAGDREKYWIGYHLEYSSGLTNLTYGSASRFANVGLITDSRVTGVTGLRLTNTDLEKLKYVADHRSNGDKTEAMRVLIREEFDRLKRTDLLAIIAELERRVQQLENKTP